MEAVDPFKEQSNEPEKWSKVLALRATSISRIEIFSFGDRCCVRSPLVTLEDQTGVALDNPVRDPRFRKLDR